MSLKIFLLNLLFPISCLGCDQEDTWLCPACFKALRFGTGDPPKLRVPDLDQIFIAGDYNDPLLAEAIKKFKYNFIAALGPILARWLIMYWSGHLATERINKTAAGINWLNTTENFLIVPIPLSGRRARWRGFNQAEIIAREFAAAFGYSLVTELKRSGRRQAQASLGEKERLSNIKGAFTWLGGTLAGQKIVLIDDLATTGATLNEAARILRAAGAEQIYGLVLAKG